MTASYDPYVPASIGATLKFAGENAAEVAELILKSPSMMEKLGLRGAAGYVLHAVSLSKATIDNATRNHAPGSGRPPTLERKLTLSWQAMQTLPQIRENIKNEIVTKEITLENGKDSRPGSAWVWRTTREGKLQAQEIN